MLLQAKNIAQTVSGQAYVCIYSIVTYSLSSLQADFPLLFLIILITNKYHNYRL